MTLTLAQAQVLEQDMLKKGIIKELISASPLMGRLPFVEMNGNAYAYKREVVGSLGSVAWAAPDEQLVSNEATFTGCTASLYTLYGQIDIPNMYAKTMNAGVADQEAAQVAVKSRLMAIEFDNRAIYGSTATEGFEGLNAMCATAQRVNMVTSGTVTGAALTIAKLDELVDTVTSGPPSFLLMNKTVRRRLSQYLRTVGSYTSDRDEYGNYFMTWNEIPILVSDALTKTEYLGSSGGSFAKTGGGCSTIYAVRINEADGLFGLQHGGIDTQHWDRLEEKDSRRTRMLWYVSMALLSTKSLALLDGITDLVATA
jgi:hypothetical protein